MKHYFLIIAISALPFISFFATPLAPHTHDVVAHLPRIAAYYKALAAGQILPRWAADLNYGYGMPLFNFIYHVPYLVTSVPVALGSTLVFAYKFALLVSFLTAGVFMYLFARKFFNDQKIALVVALLYQFTPFHLIDLVDRGDMAEGFAVAFLPLVLYAILREHIPLIAISSLLLITSHNSVSLLFFGIAILFTLSFSKNKTKGLVGLGLGLGLSAFYWMPALLERKYTYGDLFMKNLFTSHFVQPWLLFIPNITDASSLQVGDVAVSFGLMPTIALMLTFVKKIPKKIFWFCIMLTSVSVVMMLPISRFFWERIAILRMFQFPWRFLNIPVFSLSLLGGATLLTKKTSSAVVLVIVALTILPTVVYFRPPLGFDYKDEKEFWNYQLNTTFFGETDVIWSAGPASSVPKNSFEVIGGNGTIVDPVKGDTVHTFTVNAETDVHIIDHTQYFPGWRVYSDGQKIPIEFQDQNWRGRITFRLPSGMHTIKVAWEQSPVRLVAQSITLISLVAIAVLIVKPKIIMRTP